MSVQSDVDGFPKQIRPIVRDLMLGLKQKNGLQTIEAISDTALVLHRTYNGYDGGAQLGLLAELLGARKVDHSLIIAGFTNAKKRHDDERDRVIGQGKHPLQETSSPPLQPEQIALTFFSELDKPVQKLWAIKSVMALGETSSWIAPPGRGKSALLTDIGVHLAAGLDWRGYRTKAKGGVIYFALERADLVNRRLVAHRLRDKLAADLPIAVARQVISLMNPASVGAILDAIKRAEDRFGIAVALAIFDTYSKAIAAGGGDEGQAKDQNIVIANQRRIIDKAAIHIANIGHTGKDEKRGERGSNAHLADVDVQVQISGDAVKTVTVTKANDQPEDVLTAFRLEPYDFGTGDDGEPFRTFILSPEILAGGAAEGRRLTNKQQLALDALTETLLSHGRASPTEFGLPNGIKVVTADQWRSELYRQHALEPDAANPRARFNELRQALKTKRLIGARDDFVWLPVLT